MSHFKKHPLALLCLLMLGSLLLSACKVVEDNVSPTQPPEGTFAVDPTFRELYALLGGEAILGYPISPKFEYQGISYQYTEKAMMRYDPLAQVSQQFTLASLGGELGMHDQPLVVPDQPGLRNVDGFLIYDEFVSLYDKLQGARFAGRPLTQVRINYDHGRVEQYFTNVGFYRRLNEPAGEVHLLDYGAWKCDRACRQPGDVNAIVTQEKVFPEPFISSLSRLGPGFTGHPLSEPYKASDGNLEQIYENLVVFADPADVRLIHMRPITAQVGYPSTGPTLRLDDNRVIFVPTEGDLGHNVPTIFEQYITFHGGFEISGKPTTEIFPEGGIYRQCFTNYCLDYDPSASSEEIRIRLAPLGVRYLEQYPPLKAAYQNLKITSETTNLTVWESHSLITSAEEQSINLEVLESTSQAPIPNLEARLTITLPDGRKEDYSFEPTGSNGRSSVTVPAIDAPNGTLIPYKVCVSPASSNPLCVTDTYVIWGNP
ncbi:MAG TPA: hypothetical protein VMT46_06860 [Anaerolineaceae bacterium]|nr:hypothetical protein [Anaerolineaceae bacterium]